MFFRKSGGEWKDTPLGKKYMEKIKESAMRQAERDRELFGGASAEKLGQYRIFRVLFPVLYCALFAVFLVCMRNGLVIHSIVGAVVLLACFFLLYLFPPRMCKWRSVFIVCMIAVLCDCASVGILLLTDRDIVLPSRKPDLSAYDDITYRSDTEE